MHADVEYLHDVRMLQGGNRLRLRPETSNTLCSCVTAGQDHLQGDQTVRVVLARLVDDTHAAPAEFAKDVVTGQRWQPGGGRVRGGCAERESRPLLRRRLLRR